MLKKYYGQNAEIIDTDGKRWTGTLMSTSRIVANRNSMKQYYRKRVEMVDSNGRQWTGFVTDYYFPDDNESGRESILLYTPDDWHIEFEPEDIGRITVIP